MKKCPCCGQSIPDPNAPKLICSRCGRPIRKGHGWMHGADGRPQHRNCEGGEMTKKVESRQMEIEVAE